MTPLPWLQKLIKIRPDAGIAGEIMYNRKFAEKVNVTVGSASVGGTETSHVSTYWFESIKTLLISERFLIPAVVTILICVCITLIVRAIRANIKHKRVYGDHLFPPFGPNIIVSALFGLSEPILSTFFEQCLHWKGTITRLNSPFINSPMMIAVGDIDVARDILQDHTTMMTDAHRISMTSLPKVLRYLILGGPSLRISRKYILSALGKDQIDRIHKVCKDRTEAWIRSRLERSVDAGEALEIRREMLQLTAAIILQTVFEYKITKEDTELVITDLPKFSKDSIAAGVENPFRSTSFRIWSSSRSRMVKNQTLALAEKMVASDRKKRERGRTQVGDTLITRLGKDNDHDEHVIRVAETVLFLLGTGLENTADSLTWTLVELARNKDIFSDLRKALKGNDDVIAKEMQKDVLREGMRLRPAVPSIGLRTTGRDFYLTEMGIVIPKGSHVLFPTMLLTRNGVEDPETFRPSRWRSHPDKSFLLFSSGKRSCIGQNLALTQMSWILSRLCVEYDFDVDVDADVDVEEEYQDEKSSGHMSCEGFRLTARRAVERK